jgi:hypothetical protein
MTKLEEIRQRVAGRHYLDVEDAEYLLARHDRLVVTLAKTQDSWRLVARSRVPANVLLLAQADMGIIDEAIAADD